MDYEKKYNEALERARYVLHTVETAGCAMHKDLLTEIFPELAESEDEKIRKSIVATIEQCPDDFLNPKNRDRMLAWLEKQKEQKPAEYLTEEKVFAIMKKLTSLSFCVPLGSNEEKQIHEITSDVRSLLDYPIEQKPAWSEEDEKRIKQLIYDTEAIRAGYEKRKEKLGDEFNNELIRDCDAQIAWLKSLRPQPHWKPNEEQMEAFCSVLEHEAERVGSSMYLEKANSLYEQLKKL